MKYAIYLCKGSKDPNPFFFGTTTMGYEEAEYMAGQACNDNPEFTSWRVSCIDDLDVEDLFREDKQ